MPHAAPQIGTFQAVKSKYYSDQVMDPVSGAHYDADTGKSTDAAPIRIEVEETNPVIQLAIYAGFLVVVIGICAALASRLSGPGWYLGLLGVSSFAAGLAMPLLFVVPFACDDSDDIAWALGLILIFGPFVGALAYGVLWVVRQQWNPAIVGVFVSYLLIRIGLDLATGHNVVDLFAKMLPDMNFANWPAFVARWMPLVGLLGWYAADMFKKPDE